MASSSSFFFYSFLVLSSLGLIRRLDGGAAFDLHWYPATATWYGSPDGDGSDGDPLPSIPSAGVT